MRLKGVYGGTQWMELEKRGLNENLFFFLFFIFVPAASFLLYFLAFAPSIVPSNILSGNQLLTTDLLPISPPLLFSLFSLQ
jgi:hypothetical protein